MGLKNLEVFNPITSLNISFLIKVVRGSLAAMNQRDDRGHPPCN